MKIPNLALMLLYNVEAFTPSTTFISKRSVARNSELYYIKPPPQTLDQMLKNSPGFQNFIDEINQAEKAVADSIAAAESIARTMIAENIQQSSVANNLVQDFKAAEGLTEAAIASVVSESDATFDLKTAAGGVVDSIKEAEAVIESIAARVLAATGGDIDDSMKDALEAAAINVRNSMEAAESVAYTIEKVASEDSEAITVLEATGTDLAKSIESAESVAESAVTDISADTNVVKSLESAASDVMEEMKAAEAVAEAVAKVTKADAEAVVSLEPSAKDVVESIKAVESAIDATSSGGSGFEALKTATVTAMEKVKADEVSVQNVVQAVAKDIESDATAVNVLKSADSGISELIKAAEEVARDVFDDTKAVAALNAKAESVLESIKSVESVAAAGIANSGKAKAIESTAPVLITKKESLSDGADTSEASSVVEIVNGAISKSMESAKSIYDTSQTTEDNSIVEIINGAIGKKSLDSEISILQEKSQMSVENTVGGGSVESTPVTGDGVELLAQTGAKKTAAIMTDEKVNALSGLDAKVESVVQSVGTNIKDVGTVQTIVDGVDSQSSQVSVIADSGIEDLIKAAEEVAKDMADVTEAVTSLNAKAEYVLESIKTLEAAALMKTATNRVVTDTTTLPAKSTKVIEVTFGNATPTENVAQALSSKAEAVNDMTKSIANNRPGTEMLTSVQSNTEEVINAVETATQNIPVDTSTLTALNENADVVSESTKSIEAIVSDCANCATDLVEAIVSTTNLLL